jgi:hypothetical protein
MARSKEKEKNLNRLLPKLWYGWFGRGTNKLELNFNFKSFKKNFKKI